MKAYAVALKWMKELFQDIKMLISTWRLLMDKR
jgi:hypothetical protein